MYLSQSWRSGRSLTENVQGLEACRAAQGNARVPSLQPEAANTWCGRHRAQVSFPNGGVLGSPNFAWTCWMSFFAEHCPKRCSTNNPPSDVIGVVVLGAPRSRCRDANVAGKTQVDLRKG